MQYDYKTIIFEQPQNSRDMKQYTVYFSEPVCHKYIGDKFNKELKKWEYDVECDEWQRQLAATVLNEHSGWTQRTRVLIRTVGQQVRGVLSDSYRRLNSVEILTAFVQEASQQGAVIADAYMSDTKVWAEPRYCRSLSWFRQ